LARESAALGIAAAADREQARLVDRLLRGFKTLMLGDSP
jgi:hypothetical protein